LEYCKLSHPKARVMRVAIVVTSVSRRAVRQARRHDFSLCQNSWAR